MIKKALAYVFIYGITASALVLALLPVSFTPAARGVSPVPGVVPALEVSFSGQGHAFGECPGAACPYVSSAAASGRCPYLAAMTAAGCPMLDPSGAGGERSPGAACPFFDPDHDTTGAAPDGAVRAVLPGAGPAHEADNLPL